MEHLKEIIKYILKANHLGILETDFNLIVALIGLISFIATGLFKTYLWLRKKINIKRISKEIPFFSENEIQNALKFYIHTNCQSVSPSIANEPGQSFAFVPKSKLIQFFIKNAFKYGDQDYKYYILLADSGMGKTTFMINLYITYNKIPWLSIYDRYKIKLIPLGEAEAMNEITKIPDEEKGNTILLLDAFDEDNQAVLNYKNRLDEILNATKKFKKIVITCRTQFFSSEEEEPQRTGLMKYGGQKGEHIFAKLYVSPFDDKDVKNYIQMKFPIYKFNYRYKAFEIVKKSPNLMVRPMLLSYIDDFLNPSKQERRVKEYAIPYIKFENFSFTVKEFKIKRYYYQISYLYAYQIYETLIEKWIDREASRSTNSTNFKSELYKFSKEVAIDIYEKRFDRGGLFILSTSISELANLRGIKLEQLELKSRSLLNRNAEGHYKFSHRSILEYFLSLEAINNENFIINFNFNGMENVRLFLSEMGIHKFVKSFFSKHESFTIEYCTSSGFMGRIYDAFDINLNFVRNTIFIAFEEKFLYEEDVKNVIITFSSLKVLSQENCSLSDFHYRYKELLTQKRELDNQLTNTTSEAKLSKLRHNINAISNSLDEIDKSFQRFKNFEKKIQEIVLHSNI